MKPISALQYQNNAWLQNFAGFLQFCSKQTNAVRQYKHSENADAYTRARFACVCARLFNARIKYYNQPIISCYNRLVDHSRANVNQKK